MRCPLVSKRLTAVAVVVSLCTLLVLIVPNQNVGATILPATKVSPDLRKTANTNLTPSLVKILPMFTAQPLRGANTLEQDAGQLNVTGTVSVAKIVNYSNGLLGIGRTTFGSALLTQSAPVPQTTISNITFPWNQGLIIKRATITGRDLLTRYKLSYGKGSLPGDGVNEGQDNQYLNSNMWVSGLSLGNFLTRSDGTTMFGGSSFLSNVIFVGGEYALGDGYALGEGYAFGDGFSLGDGYALGDGFALGDCSLGDNGPSMR